MKNTYAFGDAGLPLRFWSKVLPCDDGCWIWIGAISDGGYGYFGAAKGLTVYTHRHAYAALVGPIAPGLDVDHLCRNRDCCNPAHLEPVTRQVNVDRGESGKHWSSRTHCPKGHAYDEANTRWRSDRKNSRECRACHGVAARDYRAFRAEVFPRLRPLTPTQVAALNALLESA